MRECVPHRERHSALEIALYLAIVFGVTWGVAAVVLGAKPWFEARFGPLTGKSPAFYLAVWAPDLAAVTLSLAFGGWRELRALFSRLGRWRAGPLWWLAALGLYPATLLVMQVLGAGLGRSPAPAAAWTAAAVALVNPWVWSLGPTGEELGWRGFLLPRLLERLPPLGAALVCGAIWMVWHVPAFLVASLPQSHASLPVFMVCGISLSVLMTWIYLHTDGSLLLAGVLPHLVVNAMPSAIADNSGLQGLVVGAAALLLVALAGRDLARPHGRGRAIGRPKSIDASTA